MDFCSYNVDASILNVKCLSRSENLICYIWLNGLNYGMVRSAIKWTWGYVKAG